MKKLSSRDNLDKIRVKLTNKANSVDEIDVVGILHFLGAEDRINFFNEACRVLKKGGKLQVIIPHHASGAYYGDPAAAFPPITEHFFFTLNADWRKANKPVMQGYACDFDTTWGYGVHPTMQSRNQEYQQTAITYWREAATQIIATSIKR